MFAISSVFLECNTSPVNQIVPFYDNYDKYMKYRYNFLGVRGNTGAPINHDIFIWQYIPWYFFLAVLVLSVSSRLYQKIYKRQETRHGMALRRLVSHLVIFS